jgi:hypothetical protein
MRLPAREIFFTAFIESGVWQPSSHDDSATRTSLIAQYADGLNFSRCIFNQARKRVRMMSH